MTGRRIIYDAPQEVFFEDVRTKRIFEQMQVNFEESCGRRVGEAEYRSWRNSTVEIKNALELSGLCDIYIAFEYQVPYTQKRIDCLLFGKNVEGRRFVVHIEVKQWDMVRETDVEGNFVETYVGGGERRVAHPSQQVEGYHDYLIGFVEVFEEKALELFGCSYCHNYKKRDGEGLFAPQYEKILEKYPVYTADKVHDLAERLKILLSKGDGFEVFNKFMQSPIHPSKKLLENVSKIVENENSFTLLNDQVVARNIILNKIKKAERDGEKSVILIKGGPGTGKTVIALHVLAEIAATGKKKIFFSCKSKPLIEGIRNRVGRDARLLFTNLAPFVPARTDENEIDVLIIDEAHRIGKNSNHQFTKADERTDMPQVEQLVRCAKTSVFFIDDKQVIRGLEIGNTQLIKEAAKKYGRTVEEVELISQFRCNGSDNYLDWLESVLGHKEEGHILRPQDNFDFKIFDSPEALYKTIVEKDARKGSSARLVAGFCWPWSSSLDSDGELVKDVRIGDFAMPWETHGNITRPPVGYVRWYEWAYKPEGIKQVGCIYTAQGFEFDYVGVIVGPDLAYDEAKDRLVGNLEGTKDPVLRRNRDKFDEYVRNIYRVLMSRGMKGCYVYFVDKEVEAYFKGRIKG